MRKNFTVLMLFAILPVVVLVERASQNDGSKLRMSRDQHSLVQALVADCNCCVKIFLVNLLCGVQAESVIASAVSRVCSENWINIVVTWLCLSLMVCFGHEGRRIHHFCHERPFTSPLHERL